MLASPGATQPIHPERESFGEKQANSASLIRRIPQLRPDTNFFGLSSLDFKVLAWLKLNLGFDALPMISVQAGCNTTNDQGPTPQGGKVPSSIHYSLRKLTQLKEQVTTSWWKTSCVHWNQTLTTVHQDFILL